MKSNLNDFIKNKQIKDRDKIIETIKKRIKKITYQNQKNFNEAKFFIYKCNCYQLVGLNTAIFLINNYYETKFRDYKKLNVDKK